MPDGEPDALFCAAAAAARRGDRKSGGEVGLSIPVVVVVVIPLLAGESTDVGMDDGAGTFFSSTDSFTPLPLPLAVEGVGADSVGASASVPLLFFNCKRGDRNGLCGLFIIGEFTLGEAAVGELTPLPLPFPIAAAAAEEESRGLPGRAVEVANLEELRRGGGDSDLTACNIGERSLLVVVGFGLV